MKLAELHTLMTRHGSQATAAEVSAAEVSAAAHRAVTIAEAMGQRMVRVPGSYDYEGEAAECTCGLLLAELPRPVKVKRMAVVLGKARELTYFMSHAHIAPGVCLECYEQDTPCAGHPAMMCDTPEPELCGACGDAPAALGGEVCRACAVAEEGPQWEPDLYYGRW